MFLVQFSHHLYEEGNDGYTRALIRRFTFFLLLILRCLKARYFLTDNSPLYFSVPKLKTKAPVFPLSVAISDLNYNYQTYCFAFQSCICIINPSSCILYLLYFFSLPISNYIELTVFCICFLQLHAPRKFSLPLVHILQSINQLN